MPPKKKNPHISNKTDFPFTKDENHVYNQFIDNEIGYADMGSHKFKFELHGNLIEDGHHCDGVTDFDSFTIKLEVSLEDSPARETIIHEVLHCMFENIGLHEHHFDGRTFSTSNESAVNSLGKQFIQFYKLNPQFMSVLFHDKRNS